jgi:hypothetical protein
MPLTIRTQVQTMPRPVILALLFVSGLLANPLPCGTRLTPLIIWPLLVERWLRDMGVLP